MPLLACLLTATSLAAPPPTPSSAVECLSFNIRYDNADDGKDAWPLRRELVLEVVRDDTPDFIGLQEALPHQQAWIVEALAAAVADGGPRYAVIGRTREASPARGEATPLLFREDRWERLDGGTFWLSETPHIPGSRSWRTACPRIATFGRFRPRGAEATASGEVLVVNTHFDHISAEARLNGAGVIRSFLDAARRDDPDLALVVMGDLNAGPNDPAVARLSSGLLRDAHRAAGNDESLGTMNAFGGRAAATGRQRIDFILVSEPWAIGAASIDDRTPDGRCPSDHFPVRATLERSP